MPRRTLIGGLCMAVLVAAATRDTRLADAIAELNRYSDTKIELADPVLENLRLSGAFATGHPTVFVEAITAYFPIEITRSDDRALILKARK